MTNTVIKLIDKNKKIPADVCSTCRHPEKVEAVCVDGDDVTLFCWNIDAYVRPFTRCSDWGPKP